MAHFFLGTKFNAKIDVTDLSPVKQIASLKEILVTKVRTDKDGLVFNFKGYKRAESILKSEYGKN